jgi:hypothetical protein
MTSWCPSVAISCTFIYMHSMFPKHSHRNVMNASVRVAGYHSFASMAQRKIRGGEFGMEMGSRGSGRRRRAEGRAGGRAARGEQGGVGRLIVSGSQMYGRYKSVDVPDLVVVLATHRRCTVL